MSSFIIANVPSQITTLIQNTVGYQAGTVQLLWQKPEENGSKILYYSVTRDVGTGVFFEVYRGLNPQFTDSALSSGQSYNYKVKAYNAKGFGLESISVIAVAGAIPLQIQTVQIKDQSREALSISWDGLTFVQAGGLPILNYVVISDNADFIYTAPVLNGLSLVYTKVILQPGNAGKTYRFRVAAQNMLGTGPFSNEIQLVATDPP